MFPIPRFSFFCLLLSMVGILPLYSQNGREYVDFLVTVNHPDRNYKIGEEAIVKVEAYKGGIPLDGVEVRYAVGDEMLLPESDRRTSFDKGLALISMGTSDKPGFRQCDLEFDVFGKTYKSTVKVGYEVHRIKPFTVMPDDFQKFWQKEIKQARKVDLNPIVTPLPHLSDEQVDVSLVRLTVGEGGRCFYGYLSKPKKAGKYPVMFCPPGAGPYKRWAQKEFAYKGFVVLNVDIHGLNPEMSKEYFDANWNKTFAYWNRGLENRDSCYFRQVYAGCVRCVDYLCSLAEWDGVNVVCKDGSQGGALSIVTAALHEHVSLVCAAYPALCDLTGFAYGRAGGWPKYFFAKSKERKSDDKILTLNDKAEINTLGYYDVVNFARILEVPGYYYFGYNDDTCSPTSIFGMLNEMKAPKQVSCTYTNAHFNYGENSAKAADWVMDHIKK